MIPFPAKVLDAHAFVTGKTGAGKSSAMRVVAEHLLDHNKRLIVIDPKGDWYGVRSSADGKSTGYPVITFGNFKGDDYEADVPINEHSGQHVAELLTSGNRPAIIGLRGWFTSHMTHFWIDFAKQLFHSNEGELYLMIDEAQNFAPKGSLAGQEGKAATGLHWTNRLLAEGRGLGINIWVGSQRPQKVHNDTLDGCETLIAMRTVHPAARGALVTWMKGTGDKDATEKILTSLAEMPRGDAWVWSPEIEFGPKKVTFPMFTTFDSFAPPQLQKKISRQTWADVDLDEVKEKLATVIKEAEAKDPSKLRAKISQLENELRKREGRIETKTETKIEKVEVLILKENEVVDLQAAANSAKMAAQELSREASRIEKLLEKAQGIARDSKISRPQMSASAVNPTMKKRVERPVSTSANGGISGVMQRILDAIAELQTLGVTNPVREMVALMAGYTNLASTGYVKAVSQLRTLGLIDYPDSETITFTESGTVSARFPDSPRSSAEIQERVCKVIGGKSSEILRPLIDAYPSAMERRDVAASANYTNLASTGFVKAVSRLRTLGFIDYPDSQTMVATSVLFLK